VRNDGNVADFIHAISSRVRSGEYYGRRTASQTPRLRFAILLDVTRPSGNGHEQPSAAMPLKLGQLSLTMMVMPVNPDAMMIPPSPMSRHPVPSIPAFPIPRPVAVVRAVADFNKDTRGRRRWGECARAKESAQHDQKISFHPFTLIRKRTCVGLGIFKIYRRDYTGASARCSLGSTHLPCSRIKSCNRPTASASGMLNFTGVLPT
jgi:hypothetical protein